MGNGCNQETLVTINPKIIQVRLWAVEKRRGLNHHGAAFGASPHCLGRRDRLRRPKARRTAHLRNPLDLRCRGFLCRLLYPEHLQHAVHWIRRHSSHVPACGTTLAVLQSASSALAATEDGETSMAGS